MIRKNIGKTDMFIRLLLGIILLILAVSIFQGTLEVVVAILGVVFLLTGIFGYCPLYSIFGISSRENKLDKITKNDIKKAVKEYKVEEKNPSVPSTSSDVKTTSSKKIAKKTAKKAVKKTAKKSTKKASKKTTKKSTKKATKKTTKKVAN